MLQRPQLPGTDSSGEEDKLLALPSPDDQKGYLTAAINIANRGGDTAVATSADMAALAIEVSEDISMGAISQAGALPMGEDMKWLKFVEDKLRRDNKMSHQDIMSSLGSSVTEDAQAAAGGLNVTLEEDLMEEFTRWFEKGGGRLRYVKPSISKEKGLTLIATEELHRDDVVISIPIKLTMCRISARNVLTKKSKYLGEELKKTFEKNEVSYICMSCTSLY